MMLSVSRKKYFLALNERSGTLDALREAGDFPDVNLTHKDAFAAFGSISVTRKGVPWTLQDTRSPLGKENYVFQEQRLFAQLSKADGGKAVFRNPVTGHSVTYEFEEGGFSVRWQGTFPNADQIAVDLNMAFLDLRQNDPQENQFVLKSFYADDDRNLCYLYLTRIGHGDHGILLHTLKHGYGWRLRYANSPYIPGLQLIYRFSEQIDPRFDATPDVDFRVKLSFHDSLDEALDTLAVKEGIPLLNAPVKAAYPGEPLQFAVHGEARITLTQPDGTKRDIPVHAGRGQVLMEKEGFYRLSARAASGKYYELILHCASMPLDVLRRSRNGLTPYFRNFNAENQAWVQGMLQAHRLLGPDDRMSAYLHDFLSLVGQQGRPDIFPGKLPPKEESQAHLELRCPGREHYTK
ncbi:MAG: hypothetical protein J5746_09590, partial [Victivallales bacterium]|nr:hypothetical protein [Victivallales bacterium]